MIKLFKIRASAASKIMAGEIGLTAKQLIRFTELRDRANTPGAKALTDNMKEELAELLKKHTYPELPKGAKTYCELWVKQQIYKRKKEFTSKQTEKGNLVELDSFPRIAAHLKLESFDKNDEFFENDFMHGTPDIVLEEPVIDAKNSWDCFSFPLFDDEVPYDENYWQGQVYMELTGKKEALFVYVLSDTPEKLIINEAKSYCYRNGFEMSPEWVDEFRERMTYPTIDEKYKIKVFKVERNDADINAIAERVKMCRAYIATLEKSQQIESAF